MQKSTDEKHNSTEKSESNKNQPQLDTKDGEVTNKSNSNSKVDTNRSSQVNEKENEAAQAPAPLPN